MPTPSTRDTPSMLSPPPERTSQLSCPPEQVRIYSPRSSTSDDSIRSEIVDEYTVASQPQQPTPPVDADAHQQSSTELGANKTSESEQDGVLADSPSPVSIAEDSSECEQRTSQSSPVTATASGHSAATAHYSFDNSPAAKHRFLPNSTSSFLRHGSKFHGTQKSDRQVYDVSVEIKHVDMEESFLCGYLRIQGLTDDHPTLTTYFEGEIVGNKHGFITKHAEWGSSEKTDSQHWARFPAYRPLQKQAKRSDFNFNNFAQRENIFMRWKEYFLVPDHRVTSISGASFEGFYYICFNQVNGSVSGIYFHAKSEKFQQLELKHVPDQGCMGAIEFR